MIRIRPLATADFDQVAEVHAETFPRQRLSREWIECNHRAYPRIQYFVAEEDGSILGFIEWIQKSGFRDEAVIELEQLGVRPVHQGKGVGKLLIRESLPLVAEHLRSRGGSLKHAIVTTRADNDARHLYARSMGAEVEAVISNLYSSDEVLMIARNIGARLSS